MIAAIYVRKSTDDDYKGAVNKSTTRQIENAKFYIEKHDWQICDEHIYVDDGISGTVFPRPGLTRLMDQLDEFDAVVMMDGDRLGRDQEKTPYYRAVINRKARIFYYLEDKEYIANSPMQILIAQIEDFRAAMEVEKASQRSRDALIRKADKGLNVGGIIYGYDNYWVAPDQTKQKAIPGQIKPEDNVTIFKINLEQANTIGKIYRMYADGYGHTTIAKTMNGDPRYQDRSIKYFDGQTPSSPRKGTGSWAPSSIRTILYNERYIGKVHYGKYRKLNEGGIKKRQKQEEFITYDAPELRIIDEELWDSVQKRLKSVAKTYIRDNNGNMWGRPGMGIDSKYLLTSLGHCSVCGSNITILGGSRGSGNKRKYIYYYGCSYHHQRGSSVCSNNHKERMEILDSAVLESIEHQVLTPDAVTYTIEKAYELVQTQLKNDPERPRVIKEELGKLRRELGHFMGLIAGGKTPTSIIEQISQREERIKLLEHELVQLQAEEPTEIDMRFIKKALQTRIGKFKELVHSDVPVARQALRKLLTEPIQFTPVVRKGRKTYDFEGKIATGALLSSSYIRVASPRGFEPLLPP